MFLFKKSLPNYCTVQNYCFTLYHYSIINRLNFNTMKTQTTNNQTVRSLSEIANEIRKDWKNVHFAAKPYLSAMSCLNSINDNYGMDSAKSIVLYFLSNASTWRGEKAKAIKAELKKIAGIK